MSLLLPVICIFPAASWSASQQPAAESQAKIWTTPASPTDPLTNKDVLEMLKSGMTNKAIVAKIRTSPCKFDKSAKALDELKAADVPYSVLAAMMQAPDPDAEPPAETPAAAPATPPAPGAATTTAVAAPPGPGGAPLQPAPAAAPAPVAAAPATGGAPLQPPSSALTNSAALGHRPPANSPAPEGAVEVTIPDSTPFWAKLDEDLTSSKIKKDNFVFFSVAEDVKINGITVIAQGAPVRGRVIDAKKSRSWGRGARIFITMMDVRAANGELMPVRAASDLRGRDTNQKMKNAAIATGQVSWALAPLWGVQYGGSVGVPAGTKFQVYVYGARTLSVIPAAPAPTAPNGAVPQKFGAAS